ncbi:MAG: Lar family restriction alleviation protein, partial [Erysipelotrichaceae bacterium]|nr:Lar family restriction alleviation protein [Erysipelotrichaceae bacterium]
TRMKLKPCPLCGGKAVLKQMGWLYCSVCGAKTTSTLTGEDGENEAAAKRSRRSRVEGKQ